MAEYSAEQTAHSMQSIGLMVVAAGIGYVAGTLLAPKSGREMRQELGDKAKKVQENAKAKAEIMRHRIASVVDKATDRADKTAEESRDVIDTMTRP